MRALVLVSLLCLPFVAEAAKEGPGVDQRIVAAHAEGPISIDGRLDEPAWQAAVPFSSFAQVYPGDGAAPSERTELRVLTDGRNLYIGVRCFDSKPEQIVASLGRRDSLPSSDTVTVSIDAMHNHRNAAFFAVNAAGGIKDGLIFDDTQQTTDWDAIWDAATSIDSEGWTAELVIPLRVLNFPDVPIQTWGFEVRRDLTRTHEQLSTVFIAREANALVSRFGHLIVEARPSASVEVTPYLAGRTEFAPGLDDPTARVIHPSADLGLDLKAALPGRLGLKLNLTINPDFGQVESDQILFNLSSFEPFYPEKRPFFTEGLEQFLPVGASEGRSVQTLFYSRRIGLDAPILAALKVTSTPTESIQVSVLDAVVAQAPPSVAGSFERRLAYNAERPLHLGLTDELPASPQGPRNYLASTLRYKTESGSAGLTYASMVPLVDLCRDPRAKGCEAASHAVAGDLEMRSKSGAWGFYTQLTTAVPTGGPNATLLKDGTLLRPDDFGYGGYLRIAKMGGEPFRFNINVDYASPNLELNKTGYMATQNLMHASTNLYLVRPNGLGPLLDFTWRVGAQSSWTTDGRYLNLNNGVSTDVSVVLPGYHRIGCFASGLSTQLDVREVGSTGIPFERHPTVAFGCVVDTDPSRAFSVSGYVEKSWHLAQGPTPARDGYAGELATTVRWHPRVETRLTLDGEINPSGPRYFDQMDKDRYRFGDLDARFVSLALRQLLVLTPRLTLQGYLQLFSLSEQNQRFFDASPRGSSILAFDLVQVAAPAEGFHTSSLNVNVVLRWEFAPGSTLYAIYTRSQLEPALAPGATAPTTVLPVGLTAAPATDTAMLKLSYTWGS